MPYMNPENQALAGGPDPMSPDDVRQVLERILNSKHFSQAPKKRKFVETICEYYLHERAHELNEHLIGREVYERSDRYSPSEDPIVRVAAHDVRKRLELYYLNEGKNDPIRLEIPVGSYEPVFKRMVSATAAPLELGVQSAEPAAPQITPDLVLSDLPARRPRQRLWIGTGLVVIALAGVISLISYRRQRAAFVSTDQGIYGPVWTPFFNSNDPTILVLSNPPAYMLVNHEDPEVFFKQSIELPPERSQELRDLLKEQASDYPAPYRIHLSPTSYTGVGEAIGVHRITDLFRSQGLAVTLRQSRNLSAEELKDHNLVMLGGLMSNEWSGKLPSNEDFYFTPRLTIFNRHPKQGEQSEYRTKFNEKTGQILEDYALVTVKPATHRKNSIMILEGIRGVSTGAAAEFVTGKTTLGELNYRLQEMSGERATPKFYQVLLKVGVESHVPTKISLVALHEIVLSEN